MIINVKNIMAISGSRAIYFFSSSALKHKGRYPYKFGGLNLDYQNLQSRGVQIYGYAFNSDLTQFFTDYYRSLLQSLQSKNQLFLNEAIEKNILSKIDLDDVQLINKEAPIQIKHYEHKLIMGLGSDRNQHQESLMRLANFPEQNTSIFLGAQKIFNPKKLTCLMQSKILYKSACKLKPINTNKQFSVDPNSQQVHMVQYQMESCLQPQSADLQQRIKQYKSSIGMFDMFNSKKMLMEIMIKIMGINLQNCAWLISDIDDYLQGNHPKIYTSKTENS